MSYVIYPLRFETAIHFGQPGRGGRLDEACMEYPADALFGALCTELAAAGETEQLARLTARIEAGELRFSDLLPWQAGRQGALAFFLPRPVLRIERTQQQEREDYSVTCANATLRKKQKKLKYLRASRIEDYIRAMQSGSPFEESDFDGDFGAASLRQHVNMRGDEPLPYYVGQFDFHAHAGLYLLADVRREEDAQWLQQLFSWLGRTGIGGKRTSGYGKFLAAKSILTLDAESKFEDLTALRTMLDAADAPWQLALAPVLPAVGDIPAVKEGAYRLRRAGGFISHLIHEAKKKNSVYLLDAGSCLRTRVRGTLGVLGEHGGHPVWRYGFGLYAGVPA